MTKRYTVTVEVTATTEEQADRDVSRWIFHKTQQAGIQVNDSSIALLGAEAIHQTKLAPLFPPDGH